MNNNDFIDMFARQIQNQIELLAFFLENGSETILYKTVIDQMTDK